MTSIPAPKFLRSLKARPRLMVSIVVAGLMYILLPHWIRLPARILITWNSGAICFLALALSMITRATPQQMHRRAQREDEGRLTILTIIVAGACTSLLAIGFMLKDNKGLPATILSLHVTLAFLTVVSSWLLMHTMFALHYAHNYYRNNSQIKSEGTGCLNFPSDDQPDYWDFLYFSFVIGMTCQVADVSITSRATRQLALVHGILTFFFNTVILAISINIIAGLI